MKSINSDSLNWKPVEIPDNLESYEGLYGLEEIDGVDVKIVNGRAQFVVKGDELAVALAVEEETGDEEEFRGFSDGESDGESGGSAGDSGSGASDGSSDGSSDDELVKAGEKPVTASTKASTKVTAKDAKASTKITAKSTATTGTKSTAKSTETLAPNTFAAVQLPQDVALPKWTDCRLSTYALTALAATGFTAPTPIQKQTIPLALDGKDVIGKATTGSGKTLAYGLPILEQYAARIAANSTATGTTNNTTNSTTNSTTKAPVAVVFVPTRELAHQVVDHLTAIAKYFPFPPHAIVSITGGLSIQKQERLLTAGSGPGIVVATPGRALELVEKHPALAVALGSTDVVVLDEADRLLQDGHFDEFERILSIMKKNRSTASASASASASTSGTAWRWQTLVFSATFAKDLFAKLTAKSKPTGAHRDAHHDAALDADQIVQLFHAKLAFRAKPTLIDANPTTTVALAVTEALVECGPTERDLYLYYFLLLYKGRTLVFANSIDSVKRLVPFLQALGVPAFGLHLAMMQKARMRSLERFRECGGSTAVLVALDVAARGLDIPAIDHVAHYHLPRTADVYVHRSGRTGRAGREGVAVMFCSPQEALGPLRKLRRLVVARASDPATARGKFKRFAADVKMLPIEDDLVKQLRPRVKLAAQLADSSTAVANANKEDQWVKQAAADLGVDEDDIGDFEDDMIKKQRKRTENKTLDSGDARAMRRELAVLLAQPLRKLSRRSYLTSGLENLAHIMATGQGHGDIIGRNVTQALDELRGKKGKKGQEKKGPEKKGQEDKKIRGKRTASESNKSGPIGSNGSNGASKGRKTGKANKKQKKQKT